MNPLSVTAVLNGPIALPGGPIALDALLAATIAQRDGLPPACTPADVRPIEIPVAREPDGRFHLASFSSCAVEAFENRFVNRRFPLAEAQVFADERLRTFRITAGSTKSYRIPLECRHLRGDELRWWCIGDECEIRALLDLVSHLGKKRSVGLGRVASWLVEPCDPWDGFPVVRDGRALRTLPPDWPGLVDPPLGYRCLTYPYWLHEKEELCAIVVPEW